MIGWQVQDVVPHFMQDSKPSPIGVIVFVHDDISLAALADGVASLTLIKIALFDLHAMRFGQDSYVHWGCLDVFNQSLGTTDGSEFVQGAPKRISPSL